MKVAWGAALISALVIALFTFSVYNFDILSVKYLLKYLFYILLTLLMDRYIDSRKGLFLSIFLPVIAIDMTTLINGKELMPLRFPFATIFPLLGIITGLIILSKKKVLIALSLTVPVLFLYLSHTYFIPRILWAMSSRIKIKPDTSILSSKFKTVNGDSILLSDIAKAKVQLLELYFVGCAPCEKKFESLKKIRKRYGAADLEIIMVCDGSISSYDQFIRHQASKDSFGMVFLFDYSKAIEASIGNDRQYPTEILAQNNQVQSSLVGTYEESLDIYLKSEIKKIDNLLKK